jgi:integrase
MTETTETTADERRRQLEAELARIKEQEAAEAEELRLKEEANREAQLDPVTKNQKEAIERRAREALDREFPPAWMPQKQGSKDPPELIGLVLRIDPRVGPSKTFGTYSAVIEVKATDGREWTVWANEAGALYAQLTRLRIQPGEVVGVRYRGLKESTMNPGQSYHDFRLARVEEDEGPAQPVDYDALQHGRETPALPEGEQAPKPDDDIPF